MKKFIQLSLVVILVFVLFQAVSDGSTISSRTGSSNMAGHVASSANISVEGVQMASCLVYVKPVICVQPNVGWNS
jgi:hypothetical protein